MLIQDNVRISVVYLVVEQRRDREMKGMHLRIKNLGYSFVKVS